MSVKLTEKLIENTKYKLLKYNPENCRSKAKRYAIYFSTEFGKHVTYPMTSFECLEYVRNRLEKDSCGV